MGLVSGWDASDRVCGGVGFVSDRGCGAVRCFSKDLLEPSALFSEWLSNSQAMNPGWKADPYPERFMRWLLPLLYAAGANAGQAKAL